MFTGNWKESHDSVLSMKIMDDNVTVEGKLKLIYLIALDLESIEKSLHQFQFVFAEK